MENNRPSASGSAGTVIQVTNMQIGNPMIRRLIAGLAAAAALVATLSLLRGLPVKRPVVDAYMTFAPEFFGLIIICILLIVIKPGLSRLIQLKWKPGWLESIFIAVLVILLCGAIREACLMEFCKLRIFKYKIGPGQIVFLENRSDYEAAAEKTRELRQKQKDLRYDTLLACAETRFADRAIVANTLNHSFQRQSKGMSAVQLVDAAMLGVYFEPHAAGYENPVSLARSRWDRDYNTLQDMMRNDRSGETVVNFSEECTRCFSLLSRSAPGKSVAGKSAHIPIHTIPVLRRAIAADRIESWFSFVERRRDSSS